MDAMHNVSSLERIVHICHEIVRTQTRSTHNDVVCTGRSCASDAFKRFTGTALCLHLPTLFLVCVVEIYARR